MAIINNLNDTYLHIFVKIPLSELQFYQRKKSQQRNRNNKKPLTDLATEHLSLGERLQDIHIVSNL